MGQTRFNGQISVRLPDEVDQQPEVTARLGGNVFGATYLHVMIDHEDVLMISGNKQAVLKVIDSLIDSLTDLANEIAPWDAVVPS